MTTSSATTLVGVFDDARRAQEAVAVLRKAGFREDQIGVVARDDQHPEDATDLVKGDAIAEGAMAGAAAGASLGTLWGFGVAAGFIPAIGPVIAGGTLAAILASAATGAATAGIVGALVGLGIPTEEAEYYEKEFRAGRTLVTVRTEGTSTAARIIFDEFGASYYQTGGLQPDMATHTGQSPPAAVTEHTTLDVPVAPMAIDETDKPIRKIN